MLCKRNDKLCSTADRVSSNVSIIFETYQNNLMNTIQGAVALEDADIPLGLFFTVA